MQNEITELRNQVQTLKRIVYGFGCLLVAGIVFGATSLQTIPDVIQSKRFEVVNDEGKVFVLISGSTTQPNSNKSHQEGGIISTYNSQGEKLILMGMNNHGSGAIQTKNNKGDTLVSLATDDNGNGVIRGSRIEVLNKEEGVGIALETLNDTINKNSEGSGRITVMNSEGIPGVVMSIGAKGGYVTANATVPKSPVLWSMMSVAQNDNGGTWLGGFSIRGDGGKEHFTGFDVAQMTVTSEGKGIVKTFDKNGKAN